MLHSFQQLAKFKAGTILPASTGNENNNNTAVTITAHPNKANFVLQNNKHLSYNT